MSTIDVTDSQLDVEFSGVFVEEHTRDRWGIPKEIKRLNDAWRVSVNCDGEMKFLPMAFARRRDAEMAKAALERAGLGCSKALRDLRDRIGQRESSDQINRIMAEAMQW